MKYQRVIHLLEDGRRKYSTHNGEIEKWHEYEIESLRKNREQYGDSAYTADFAKYDVVAANLRKRYPNAKILRVVGFDTEDHDLPVRTDVIF